jgi:hypothetical protein
MIDNARELIDTGRVVKVQELVAMLREQEEVPMPWLQWECTDRSLERRAMQLSEKLLQIADSKRIDPELAVGFVNSQHGADTQQFLDEFVLYDASNGEVEFRVIPYKKSADEAERAFVYHKDTGFRRPLFRGRWPDLRKWFTQYDPANPEGVKEARAPQRGVRTASQTELPKSVKFNKREVAKAEQEQKEEGEGNGNKGRGRGRGRKAA